VSGSPAVVFDRVSVTYAGSTRPALDTASFQVDEGELAVVVGRTGSGKSTLLGAVNGTVPHFTGGRLSGQVLVLGRDTRDHRPRDLADLVGVVRQDPLAGFVTDTVEEELAYTLEQLALPASAMRRRVEETLDLLGIADLRDVPLRELSGGQQQRVAIGAVLAASPRLLVLDEPTSALDPTGAEEVLATVSRLVHDLGLTVLLSEHRIERVIALADTVIHVGDDGTVTRGDPASQMARTIIAPPVIELGRWAGWRPLPLSVREARREAAGLRDALEALEGPDAGLDGAADDLAPAEDQGPRPRVTGRGLTVRHGTLTAVDAVDLAVGPGDIVALMGRNGSGKSSLLWALQGSGARSGGELEVLDARRAADAPSPEVGLDPATLGPRRRRDLVGLVPQSASDLLYLETVAAECSHADRESGEPPGTTGARLDRLAPGVAGSAHPRDLSEGQRLALVVAVQLAASPPVVLLDEPTRGLDYPAKSALAAELRVQASAGRAVVVATHDVEFAAQVAGRVVVLAGGRVVADGPARAVLCDSPSMAPQVAKILAPHRLLTLHEVQESFASTRAGGSR
jgi:energy-coupling factor transport system ATP-binding protein